VKPKCRAIYVGTCPKCGERDRIRVEDESFAYEYGSIKGVQEEHHFESECCGEFVDDKDVEVIEDFDIPDRDDYREDR
jgi:hypothetical protein